MNREAFSKHSGGDDSWSDPKALPLARSPGILDAATIAAGGDARRSGVVRDTRSNGVVSPLQGSTLSVSVEPDDLVARALAILAEETEAWRARRGADAAQRRSR